MLQANLGPLAGPTEKPLRFSGTSTALKTVSLNLTHHRTRGGRARWLQLPERLQDQEVNVLGATCRQHPFGLRPVPTCHGRARMADGEWPRAPKATGSYLGRLPEGRGSKTGAEGTGAAGCTSRFLKPDGTQDGGGRVCDQSEAAGLTLRLLPPTRKHSLCRLRSITLESLISFIYLFFKNLYKNSF